jgi:hypothetical protein
VIKVDFEGSQTGLFYLTGKPVYDVSTHVIELRDLDFDIRSKNFLVRTAKWLFNHKIISELKKYTRFDLSAYENSALRSINDQLNHEWMKGLTSSGEVDGIRIINIFPLRDYMIVRSNCTGNLLVSADIASFNL